LQWVWFDGFSRAKLKEIWGLLIMTILPFQLRLGFKERPQRLRRATTIGLFLGLLTLGSAPHAWAEKKEAQSTSATPNSSETPTDAEPEEETVRGPSLAGSIIAFGPAITTQFLTQSASQPPLGYSFNVGRAWDVQGAMITLSSDVLIQTNALMVDAGLGARFFTSQQDIAPYLGGFFGLGVAKQEANSLFQGQLGAGFVGRIDIGLQLFRTSDLHLELGLSWRSLLSSFESDAPFPGAGSFRVGLIF
jgi:hypothetical protein